MIVAQKLATDTAQFGAIYLWSAMWIEDYSNYTGNKRLLVSTFH